jgi:hypothetical protein
VRSLFFFQYLKGLTCIIQISVFLWYYWDEEAP